MEPHSQVSDPPAAVLASAFGTRGLCADLLQVILGEHKLVTGEVVIEQLRRVLIRKLDTRADKVKDVEGLLRGYHVEPRPRRLPSLNLSEQADLMVVTSAINANVEILITGDREMLDLKKKPEGLRIISPREFWNLVTRAPRKRRRS